MVVRLSSPAQTEQKILLSVEHFIGGSAKKSAGPCLSGATRLRGILCSPVFHVSYVLLAQSQDLQVRFQGLLASFRGSWMLVIGTGDEQFTLHQAGRRIWGDPRITLKTHQVSSQFPGQQKSRKLVPKSPKIIKNRTWNHKKSNFCES